MPPSKDKVSNHCNILGPTGLNAKSITGVDVWKHGGVWVVEINYTGGPYYIKFNNGNFEYGGTTEWGSGTMCAAV